MVSQVSTFLQEVQSSDLQQQEVEVAMSFNSDGSIIKANVVLIGPLNGSAAPPQAILSWREDSAAPGRTWEMFRQSLKRCQNSPDLCQLRLWKRS